jgi:hypothetical protein
MADTPLHYLLALLLGGIVGSLPMIPTLLKTRRKRKDDDHTDAVG